MGSTKKIKMEIQLALLLLAATGVLAQDEDPAAGGEEVCDKQCEEFWEYVEFLKEEISTPVTDILTNFKTTLDGEKAVESTMQGVMDVRETILKRIKDLRKGEVPICFGHNVKQGEKLSDFRMDVMEILLKLVDADASSIESLRDVGQKLVEFRGTISTEVMRVLMLPAPCGTVTVIKTDCPECAALEGVKIALEKLRDCATDKKEGEDGEEEQAAEGEDDEEAAECMPPAMFSMDLIVANEELDKSIAGLYDQIIKSTNETEREGHLSMLTMLKELRETIDEHISNLLEETEEEKIRQYKNNLNSQREEEDKKDFIREDLINFINKINEESRTLLKKKVNSETGELDECDQEKMKVIKDCKGPMWMLVNTTIFDTLDNVIQMVDAMDDQLKVKRGEYCGDDPSPPPSTDSNCEWEEYEETRNYLVKVDEVIQESLFKEADEGKAAEKKMNTLIGFVDLQAMFDKRVKKLFEEEVRCPGELDQIKKNYMVTLNKCMIDFMKPKLKFEELSRFQRISCIKGLRNQLEDRTAELLQFELENSLAAINNEQAAEAGFFLCKDGLTRISSNRMCDGKNDCPLTETSSGGEDEEGCAEGSGQVG